MLKKSLKSAVGVSIGITLGGCIIPRILFSDLYNNTFPPIWEHALTYLIQGYLVSFLVSLLINWIESKKEKFETKR
ncbi:MAG: hypothetical protein PWP24_1594 [Clostridiales bacterium]|nr:hypothetical protein [Clostridiales bacterium]